MQNYEIANKAEVDSFINSAMTKGQVLTALKGEPPKGAKYSDGELITRPINIGWLNNQTGESIEIMYQLRQQAKGGE